MTELQKSLLEAMEQFSSYRVKNNIVDTSSKVLECEIKEIVNAMNNIYIVSYLGNSYTAFGNTGTSYEEKELVYVLVPDGDFTKTKIILGSASTDGKSSISDNNTQDIIYYECGSGDLLDLDKLEPIEMNTYIETIRDNKGTVKQNNYTITCYKEVSTLVDKDLFDENIRDEMNKYKTFCFSFDVNAVVPREMYNYSSLYGVILSIPYIDKDGISKVKTARIDTDNNFNGNPYDTNNIYSKQKVYISFEEEDTFDVNNRQSIKIDFL